MLSFRNLAAAVGAVVVAVFTSGCGNAPAVSSDYLTQAQLENQAVLKALLEKNSAPNQDKAPAKKNRKKADEAKAAEAAQKQKALEDAQAKVRELEAQSARQEAEARKSRADTLAMRQELVASNARLASLERARQEEAAAKKAAEEAKKAAAESEAKAKAEAEAEAEARKSQSADSTQYSSTSCNSRPGPIRRVFGGFFRIFRCR